jgi:hypothetical protein
MATSTVLALLYVPVAYTYVDSFGTLLGRIFTWRPSLPFRRRARATAEPTPAAEPSHEAAPARRHSGTERMPFPVAGGAPTPEEPGFARSELGWRPRHVRRARLEAYHRRQAGRPDDQGGAA